MKSFKEYLLEQDSPVEMVPSATANKQEKKQNPTLSPWDEAKSKVDFERSVMGMPEIDDSAPTTTGVIPNSKGRYPENIRYERIEQKRKLEVQAREQDPKYQEDAQQRNKDLEQRETANIVQGALQAVENNPFNIVNILSKIVPGYQGSPVKKAMMVPINIGKNAMWAIKSDAYSRLSANPTYTNSETAPIQDKENKNK